MNSLKSTIRIRKELEQAEIDKSALDSKISRQFSREKNASESLSKARKNVIFFLLKKKKSNKG